MTPIGRNGSHLPTEEQTLLLRAALLHGPESLAAWQEWRAAVDMDRLDGGSFQLLPLLYQNLAAQEVSDPSLGRFKGVHHQTWYRNQLLFGKMATLLRSMEEAGVQTMLLEGAALVLEYYKDPGLRPMDGSDVAVRPAQLPVALKVLAGTGWAPRRLSVEAFTPGYLATRHAHSFEDREGTQLHLHWHVLFECRYSGADDAFWEEALAVTIGGAASCALNPRHQLIQICTHVAEWNPTRSLQWVADAMFLMREAGASTDWDRLAAEAVDRRLTLPVREGLSCLRMLLNAPVPEAVLLGLQQTAVSVDDRRGYAARSRRDDLIGGLPYLWYNWVLYTHPGPGTGAARRVWGFPGFLQEAWGLKRQQEVPLVFLRKVGRRVWRVEGTGRKSGARVGH